MLSPTLPRQGTPALPWLLLEARSDGGLGVFSPEVDLPPTCSESPSCQEQPTAPSAGARPATAQLLFALNFATGLPPGEFCFPSAAPSPGVLGISRSIASANALTSILGRPTEDVDHGSVFLGDVDPRLRGLVVSLDLFRVADATGGLIALGVVRPDAWGGDGATIADLWKLVYEAQRGHRVARVVEGLLGGDSLLVDYGGTAVLAWLSGDRLATISVTGLDDQRGWTVRTACAIADYAAVVALHDGCGKAIVARLDGREAC